MESELGMWKWGRDTEMMVLRDPERMGKDEEEMAVGVWSDKLLNLVFTTAHKLVTLDWTPSNLTSHL